MATGKEVNPKTGTTNRRTRKTTGTTKETPKNVEPLNLIDIVDVNKINSNASIWNFNRLVNLGLKSKKIKLNKSYPIELVDVILCLSNAAKQLSPAHEPTKNATFEELDKIEVDFNLFNEQGEFFGTVQQFNEIDTSQKGLYFRKMVKVSKLSKKPFATIANLTFDESKNGQCIIVKGEVIELNGNDYQTFELIEA